MGSGHAGGIRRVSEDRAAAPLRPQYGDPTLELRAALERLALADRSDLARLRSTGPDLLELLNRLGTARVNDLAEGRGRATVLTSPKGRIIERLFVHRVRAGEVWLVAGAGAAQRVAAHLERYTFAEQIGLADMTDATCQLVLCGPQNAEGVHAAGLPRPEALGSTHGTLAGASVEILGHDGLSADGVSIVGRAEDRQRLWTALSRAVTAAGGLPAGALALEAWRILRGLPASGHELTEEHNPLEAGLWDAVDFDKGCYVGQEVVARLRTYDKVSRSVVGLSLPDAVPLPPIGTPLFVEGREVGRVTSAAVLPGSDRRIALAYVKRREVRPDLRLTMGTVDAAPSARLVPLPWPSPFA
jgi:folate-binding protein YgfZ